MTVLLSVLAACLLATAAPLCAADPPYIPQIVPTFQTEFALGTRGWYSRGDFDGDGNDDFVFRHPLGLLGATWRSGGPVVLFQYNFPVGCPVDDRSPLLGRPVDVSGDGRNEVPFVVKSDADVDPENPAWRFRVFDPHRDAVSLDVELPRGVDARADGRWDGRYFLLDVLPDLAPSGGPLAVVGCVVGFDRYGRGLRAIDTRTGATVWRFDTGPNPTPYSTWTGDLTGDGRTEIVFASNSPDNLGGERINDTSDDEAWLFVLDPEGRLVWRRQIGGYFVSPYLRVTDLTGDGQPELVLATAYHGSDPETKNQLQVWSAAGDLIAETDVPAICAELLVIRDADGGAPLILHNSRAFDVRSYRLTESGLVPGPVSAETGDLSVCDVVDILPEPGREIIAVRDPLGDESRLEILDGNLRVLARDTLPPRAYKVTVAVWSGEPQRPVLIYATNGYRQALEFLPAPPVPLHQRAWVRVLALGAVFAALLAGYLVRRRRHAAEREATERDLLRRLFRELAESSHGTLAATKGVERLAWLLESHAMSGEAEGPVLERLRAGLDDFRDTVRPRLREILELAVRHEATAEPAVAAGADLERFAVRVRALEAGGLDADRIAADLEPLRRLADETTAGFVALQETVAARFGADPGAMAERLLAQWPGGLAGVDARVEPASEPASGGPAARRACVDPADLRFVLENLIGNALRAMEHADPARLTIRTGADDGRAWTEVTDTGRGIAPGDRARIFESGFSDRAGGGLGLHRSRELLAFWRGRLELLDSEPGVGSTFRIEIPLAPTANRKD